MLSFCIFTKLYVSLNVTFVVYINSFTDEIFNLTLFLSHMTTKKSYKKVSVMLYALTCSLARKRIKYIERELT